MDRAVSEEHRRLKLPAMQPMVLGDAASSTSTSNRFYLPPQPPPPSSSKNLGKRPSTATLAQSTDVLLPTTRHIPTFASDEKISVSESRGMRGAGANGGPVGSRITFGRSMSDEVTAGSSTSLQPPSITEPAQSLPIVPRAHTELNEENSLDWSSFVQAYAAGKWDPRHIPKPPRTRHFPGTAFNEVGRLEDVSKGPGFLRSATSMSGDTMMPRRRFPGTPSSSSISSSLSFGTPGSRSDSGSGGTTASSVASASYSPPAPVHPSALSPTLPHMSLKMRREQSHRSSDSSSGSGNPSQPLPKLIMPSPRGILSRSLSDSTAVSPAPIEDSPRLSTHESHHDFHAAAATMRLAGDGINVRPLALPSPEIELTDPLRGHTASIALPWSREGDQNEDQTSMTSSGSGSRKTRLNSFWNVLDDVMRSPSQNSENNTLHIGHLSGLPTISASPVGTPAEAIDSSRHSSSKDHSLPEYIPPISASVPALDGPAKSSSEDYFAMSPRRKQEPFTLTEVSGSQILHEKELLLNLPVFEASPKSLTSSGGSLHPPSFNRTVSEPLTRHKPWDNSPSDPVSDPEPSCPRPQSEIIKLSYRKVREETEYFQRGFLIPPTPPNEGERQKALYRFNIVHTAKDANFDRIALLAKLVFNAKICLISLVDADEQWFKSEFGLGRECSARDDSICAHTILQDSSEPLVILDTSQDWRFMNNPFVVKHPLTRFYAGAPLRTAEGFNIGSLCIIDSEPRSEFGPRQRHTLKEFAAIVMRELELWRDKIQLRIRDRIQISMEQFTRECLEIDTQAQKGDPRQLLSSTSMEKIYDRAAKLVKRTLDVEGAVLVDVSSFEEFDTLDSETALSVLLYHSDPKQGPQSKPLTSAGFAQMAQFFKDFPDGKVSEAILPPCIRGLMPGNVHYALTVPILNIDKRPFAILCAYNSDTKSKPYLEGHELSYLRAIGVIILSAVLKRRMILADKAKSLFISNISHELRTPLHGILAAAELLSGTVLTPNQASFLSTVQACGTSLVETVNHVLDFTKLSGSTQAGGAETVIRPARVDLAQLVEEATEGSWIGYRARHSSEIGSVYSPRNDEDAAAQNVRLRSHVETVIDIGYRSKGWMVICEKGGIRRCLMNLLGNALKFTMDGYVHVTLRQLPSNPNTPEDCIKLELGVFDSGKGISEDFLKNQLFQPFSQENPLQPGTGLGLAIVNSIVRSESVNGKIDVWSSENVGTEIRIIFEAPMTPADPREFDELGDWSKDGFKTPPSISLLGFNDDGSRGHKLLKQVLTGYLKEWWHFNITPGDSELGDILVLNEEIELVRKLIDRGDCLRPLVIISSARGDPYVINLVDDYERAGGFARIIFKPIGPTSFQQVLRLCVRILCVGLPAQHRAMPTQSSHPSNGEWMSSGERLVAQDLVIGSGGPLNRRRSDGHDKDVLSLSRPALPPRSRTYNLQLTAGLSSHHSPLTDDHEMDIPSSPSATISVGAGGLLLKTSVGSLEPGRPIHVLVVEDNSILRELLVKWLRGNGYIVHQAADGQNGVDIFRSHSIFDVVLLDISMPVLDGVGAAAAIRRIEREPPGESTRNSESSVENDSRRSTRLIALTGMSSREDKRRAFEAGVDGYLVKPVSFKTLHSMFKQLGIT